MKRAVAMLALLAACQAAPAGPRPPAPPKVFVAESPPPVVVSPRARRAAALFEEARRLEDAGIVDVAAEGYRAAYALDPRPATLAAHARALVALGDRDAAGSLFADGDHGVDAATLAAVRSAPSAPPGQRLDQALQAAGGAAPLALARARYWHRRHGGTFAVDLRHARRLGERAPSPLGQSLGLPAAFAGADVVYLEADTGVSVFDVAAGRVTRFITVPEALGVAADDAHVAVGLPGRVAVLELASGERVATLWGEPTAYANVALGRDHVAAASRDGSIAVWRRDSGALVWQHALERHWSMEVIQLRIVDSDLVVSFRGAHRLLALADGAPRKVGRACRNGRPWRSRPTGSRFRPTTPRPSPQGRSSTARAAPLIAASRWPDPASSSTPSRPRWRPASAAMERSISPAAPRDGKATAASCWRSPAMAAASSSTAARATACSTAPAAPSSAASIRRGASPTTCSWPSATASW